MNRNWHITVVDESPLYGDTRNATITLHSIELTATKEFIDELCGFLRKKYPSKSCCKIKAWYNVVESKGNENY